MTQPDDRIRDYHAHVYYTQPTRPLAEKLRAAMEPLFPQAVFGRWHDVPVGPHPSAMFQIAFPKPLFATLVPYLIVERGELTVFLHPNTGKALGDHRDRAVWLGREHVLKLDQLTDD